jgi:formate hydrogenlyase subunit 3/multisubunit Na+/H+ antiporter MnhD subunit
MSPASAAGIASCVVFPIALACGLSARPLRGPISWAASWAAPLPALALALAHPNTGSVEAGVVLLGLRLYAPDVVTRGLLLAAGLLWWVAGRYAYAYLSGSSRLGAFWASFLVTMAGNMGVILAQDIAGLYLFYAIMTFAAYGLVVHERTDEAQRAGRVYITLALIGEVLLLAAFWLLVREKIDLPLSEVPHSVATSPHRAEIVALSFAGFGVKAGVVPLHLWLPLAHPVAPTPASAILSGALVNAGLLGWLRMLPLGAASLPSAGTICASLGLLTAAYAAMVGVAQRDPKTVLAYSTVSQMGFMTTAIGAGLGAPTGLVETQMALVVFALHHALAKGALFLGVSVARDTAGAGGVRKLVVAGLAWPAFAIAGAPFTSGAVAKAKLAVVVGRAPLGAGVLVPMLSIAAVGSTLLMARFLAVIVPSGGARSHAPRLGLWLPWMVLVLASASLPLSSWGDSHGVLLDVGKVWSATWPILTGVALALAARASKRRGLAAPSIPPGDIVVLVETASRLFPRALARTRSAVQERTKATRGSNLLRGPSWSAEQLERAESLLLDARLLGAIALVLLICLLLR